MEENSLGGQVKQDFSKLSGNVLLQHEIKEKNVSLLFTSSEIL
jgi:hypothetical protein